MDTATLNALAEPNRLRIVELLRSRPYSVNEIADKLAIRQPQASKHLKVLAEAGLVFMRPIAQQRMYELEAKPLQELHAWTETYRQMWEGRLDAMAGYAQKLKTKK